VPAVSAGGRRDSGAARRERRKDIALIEDSEVIRRMLEHLGLWAPLPSERSPPVDPASWPPYASLPLTYHPVPEIA